jgi:D-tyrosyl-tRNA(Tyr) deacylase
MNEALGAREIICVSQFTLYGDVSGGNRPGFKEAASGEEAEALYEDVCERLGAKRGVFGADMRVEIIGDGPVTILIDV